MSKVSIKLYIDQDHEIRRLSWESPKSGPIFPNLVQRIRQLLPELDLRETRLCWRDAENDFVTIKCDDDLREALNERASGECLRLFVIAKTKTNSIDKTTEKVQAEKTKDQDPSSQPSDANLHSGVTCDGCDNVIRGKRFKCLICEDYDLCSACESANLHNEHSFIRIGDPNDKSWVGMWFWRRHMPPPPCNVGGGWVPPINPAPMWRAWGRQCRQAARDARHRMRQQHQEQRQQQGTAENNTNQDQRNWLRDIGEHVAAVLSGFGIDVDVDVEERPVNANNQNTEQPQQNGVPPTDHSSKTPEMNATDCVMTEDSKEKEAPGTPTSQGSDIELVEQTSEVETQPNVQQASAPHQEWTLLEPATVGGYLYPELQQQLSSATPSSVAPLHPNPQVARALGQMLAMGYTNENGWLSQLLADHNADVSAVLDLLHPQAASHKGNV